MLEKHKLLEKYKSLVAKCDAFLIIAKPLLSSFKDRTVTHTRSLFIKLRSLVSTLKNHSIYYGGELNKYVCIYFRLAHTYTNDLHHKLKNILLSAIYACLCKVWLILRGLKSLLLQIVHRLAAEYKTYSPFVYDRLRWYMRLMRVDKPIGIYLLLWPTLWALWIAAEGVPNLDVLLVFICGVFLMRSGGVIMNDIADRRFDGKVKRTKNRPLVTGDVSPLEALYLAGTLFLIAFFLVLTTNRLTVELSFIALILASLYPYAKRYTYLPQFVLGLAFGWAVPMAFAAQLGTVPTIAWALLIANILWSVSYDSIYALMDKEDDIKLGLKSTAILFGDLKQILIAFMHALVLFSFLIIAHNLKFGVWFYAGLLIATGIQVYQIYLLEEKTDTAYMKAFASNNVYGAYVFFGIAIHYALSGQFKAV